MVINFIVLHFLFERFLSFFNDKYFQAENRLEKTLGIRENFNLISSLSPLHCKP